VRVLSPVSTGTHPNSVNALLSNQGDLGPIDLEKVRDFEADSRFSVLKIPYDGKLALVMNHNKDPYKDARVRQALSLAMDRRIIVQNIWSGLGAIIGPISAALSFWALPERELATFSGYRTNHDADITEAKQLMSAAGKADGFSDAMINGATHNALVAQLLVPALAKINVKMEIRTLSSVAAFVAPLADGSFTVGNGTFLPGVEPDSQIATFQQTGGSRNYGNYSDPQLDTQLKAARRELDTNKRQQLYFDIQRYLMKGMATNFAWTNTYQTVHAMRTYVKAPPVGLQYWGPHFAEDLYLEGKS
jgi:ABC-type transport system substrate-binding protein